MDIYTDCKKQLTVIEWPIALTQRTIHTQYSLACTLILLLLLCELRPTSLVLQHLGLLIPFQLLIILLLFALLVRFCQISWLEHHHCSQATAHGNCNRMLQRGTA